MQSVAEKQRRDSDPFLLIGAYTAFVGATMMYGLYKMSRHLSS